MRTVLVFSVLSATLLACSAPTAQETAERDSAAEPSSSDGGAADQGDGSVAAPTRAHDAGASSFTLPARDAGTHDASTHDAAVTVDAGHDAGEHDAGVDAGVDAGERDAAPAADAGDSDGSVDAGVVEDAGPSLPACAGAIAASLCMPVVQCPDRVICSAGGGYGCCEQGDAPFCKCN